MPYDRIVSCRVTEFGDRPCRDECRTHNVVTPHFTELVLGDVLVAPFVAYVVASAIIVAALFPMLRTIGFDRVFANPRLALLGMYVIVLAALIAST